MATHEHTALRAPARVLRIDDERLDQLMRWHGTDESNLPPAHTLQNLSRDTVAALAELREARATIGLLRAAMGRAFWATQFRDIHAILLEALGPPPDDVEGAGPAAHVPPRRSTAQDATHDPAHTLQTPSAEP
jgi:hypothetical protein